MSVNSFYVDSDDNDFVTTSVYVREEDCKDKLVFKTKRQITIDQIDFALYNNLPVGCVIVDFGYEGEEFIRDIHTRKLDFIIGVRISTKISINRCKRLWISNCLSTLTDDNFDRYVTAKAAYFFHMR